MWGPLVSALHLLFQLQLELFLSPSPTQAASSTLDLIPLALPSSWRWEPLIPGSVVEPILPMERVKSGGGEPGVEHTWI